MDGEYGDEGDMGMMGEYDQEEGHEEHMEEYGEEGDDSFGFENNPEYADFPPLDPRRKVRREILRTINELRDKFERPNIQADRMTDKVADAYAEYLLREEESDEILK
jgi:hypothetical protein